MMHLVLFVAVLGAMAVVNAAPASTTVNPDAVAGTTCTDPSTTLVSHDINVALLGICGGIAGTIQQCGGEPTSTTGESGTALLKLNAATSGQTIDITKGRWEGCMRAARAVCGDSPFTSTCIGGAKVNAGNVDFELSAA
ncbi:uncharacterized protein EAF01_004151 [Botrytis porri]|uniref:Secreted protein n=1 Tax=Botrytis porri TaxID=87229 RepID=A0A4Z1KTM8_9HELO|nr:uncharacterized protein EAF01_004151 [Botrytis porri]KAF7908396.1 hypothetical protein EAF01_004151 [Botrytis porri]TGO87805.1 hypothetical protein BPOR_0202g00070 [Botrytis porri]